MQRGQGASGALLDVVGPTALRHDLTELEGLDFLFSPRSSIARAQARGVVCGVTLILRGTCSTHACAVVLTGSNATRHQEATARAFGAARTWFLVNGTSVGIHATVMAACAPGDAVVLSRNCHVSAVSACILAGAVPFFADAPIDEHLGIAHAVTPQALERALDAAMAACAAAPAVGTRDAPRHHQQASPHTSRRRRVGLALVVSPTYFGAAADVAALARVCHARGVPLAVDEAHGAHWAFDARLPAPSLACGADVVVQSTHKTLPALTQASMLHASHTCRVSGDRLSTCLTALQTTSPSYLLLASLDAVRQGANHHTTGVRAATDACVALRHALAAHAPGMHVLGARPVAGVHAWDPTRLTVAAASLGYDSGYAAGDALARRGITPELTAPRCVVFVIGGGNVSSGDMERLRSVLVDMHVQRCNSNPAADLGSPQPPLLLESITMAMPPRQAFFAPRVALPMEYAAGRVSAEWLCPYPPVRVSWL